jgi:hypothetical protein
MRYRKLGSCTQYSDALNGIDRKEVVYIRHTITANFSKHALAEVLWPAETCRILTDAYSVISPRDRSSYRGNLEILDMCINEAYIEVGQLGMCCPGVEQMSIDPEHPAFGRIVETLHAVYAVHKKFNGLRNIITWFNDYEVTPGAARYYFPGIVSLLPPNHAIHKADGVRYKEVTSGNIADIIPDIREGTGLIGECLLIGEDVGPEKAAPFFTVRFSTAGPSTSQGFVIL